MANYLELPLSELVNLSQKKNLSSQEKDEIAIALQAHSDARTVEAKAQAVLKEAQLIAKQKESEEIAAAKIVKDKAFELWLASPAGAERRAEIEQERILLEQDKARRERIELEAYAAQQREEQEQERLRAVAVEREYNRIEQIKREYDPETAQEILTKEKVTGKKHIPDNNTGPVPASVKYGRALAAGTFERTNPEFPNCQRHYARVLQYNEPSLNDIGFLERYEKKFKQENNNQIANTQNLTNNQIAPGTNQNDVLATMGQEFMKGVANALKYQDKAFENQQTNLNFMREVLKDREEHIRLIEKREDKHEEKMELIKAKKDNAEIKVLKLRKNYLKKHPIVAGIEGMGEAIKGVSGIWKEYTATPEELAKMKQEKLSKKVAKEMAEDAEKERQIELRVAARLAAEKKEG